ncbi:hypothetical protein KC330_g3613 [Hortaea werneckii]|nr:hypothetical protein KC330_g3613 [Hortaea werneckii]
MEPTDFLPSLIKTLAIGIAIGLSIVAAVLFILSLWKLGCILGEPVFVALLNSSPFRDTYTDDNDEKTSSGTQDSPPTKQQQQRPRLSASERKAKDARNFAGGLALFLCYVGASIEVTVATPPGTWQIPAGQDAVRKYTLWFICVIVLKGCLEGLVATAVLSGSVWVLGALGFGGSKYESLEERQ